MKTELIKNPGDTELMRAAEVLKRGGLVAFPTETVYGLGGNGLDPNAAKKIYTAKGRPSDNPLIIHVADVSDAANYCVTSPLFEKIAENFMPGPITVILPKRNCIPYEVTGGLDTVAVRIPSNPIAHRLLGIAGIPIAAPSANKSGRPSPTSAAHVVNDMDGFIDMIIDGGECMYGVESTIIKLDSEDGVDRVTLLRPGAITPEELERVCGIVKLDRTITEKPEGDFKPLAPGMKYRHYAPKAHVTLLDGSRSDVTDFMNAQINESGVGLLCYDGMVSERRVNVITLGREDDPTELAHRLFYCLREFDEMNGINVIYSVMPQKNGIGLAVYNRLLKAAGFDIKKL